MLTGVISCGCVRAYCGADTRCGTGGNPHPYVGTYRREAYDCNSGTECGLLSTGTKCGCTRK
ncbi:hypothetical protein [Bacillus arachidis]|uniref:Uncharacterized protein n=1 Tax=Bacillus arachidis TaxID=2819290 RepID=A0ABS3P5Q1_9BACI|nr:hypothetical protein [Bacillus arachidis]MBO1628370.1 hypothetical protein [Bacillus arachidis]